MEPSQGNRNDPLLARYLKKKNESNDVICVFLKLFSVLFLTLRLRRTSSERIKTKKTKKKKGTVKPRISIATLPASISQRAPGRCTHLLVVDVLPVDRAKVTVSHDLLGVVRSAAQPVGGEKRRRSQASNASPQSLHRRNQNIHLPPIPK